MGFSAGGDLCLRAGLSSDPLVKPDFLCPVYPAVPVSGYPDHVVFTMFAHNSHGTT